MDIKKISVTLMVKNAKSTILQCLDSVALFGEIVILENGSTDGTREMIEDYAKAHTQIRIFYPEKFLGFGPMKNLAIEHASNDWIFSIDADEILERDALEEIMKLELSDTQVGAIARKNLYRGKWIKACNWYPDCVLRLFNKKNVRFNQKQVHEALMVNNKSDIINLKGHLRHYSFTGIPSLINKMQYYSDLWAQQNIHKNVSVSTAIVHTLWSFIRNYFFKKGMLYGYRGLLISACNALGVFFKYLKLYELRYEEKRKEKTTSLIITTYNQRERLKLVLDSVCDLHELPDEVIIADDGSTEDTRELIKSYQNNFPCPLKHVWHEDLGFRLAKIRNEAIKEATGNYIIIIDGDIILNEHFIYDHTRYAKHHQFLQGARILLSQEETENILNKRAQGEIAAYTLAFLKRSYKAKRNYLLSALTYAFSKKTARYLLKHDLIRSTKGCNMSFYKDDALSCGLFDENFIGWGREDSDFVARFLIEGKGNYRRLKFAGIAYHLYHKENSRADDQKNYARYLERINRYRKNQQ